ncbi:MAG: FAD-binding oxidoreductase [Proteobacteria bacterium]|nr:FAD-binding oxidoreductase [Pseudomonadota bacterium]
MAQKDELTKIIGKKNVLDDQKTLDAYSRDESFVIPVRPSCVVKPTKNTEVQALIKWANETGTPLVPVSSGAPHYRGDTIPATGGAVVVDLSKMNKIIRVDRRNRVAMIEPGVTFGEFIAALDKEGLAAHMPLVPRSTKSVVGSYLEREPITMPRHHWDPQDPLLCMEVIFGDGHLFMTGSAAGPGTLAQQWENKRAQIRPMGPAQTDFQRVVQGSQGTMGIVTWLSVKCRVKPELKKSFLVPAKKVEDLLGLVQKMQKVLLGDDCLILNSHNLACIMAKDSSEVATLKDALPPYVLFISAEGRGVSPEDKVAYQVNDIKIAAQANGLIPLEALPCGLSADDVAAALAKPSDEPYWKNKAKGACRDIFFLTTIDRTPKFVKAMFDQAECKGFSPNDIGVYLQPTVNGTSCHVEFNLNCDSNNKAEMAKVKGLVNDSLVFANMGAFFSRPYGSWSDMVYRRDGETATFLKKVKTIFDPNKIMNPGKLCF